MRIKLLSILQPILTCSYRNHGLRVVRAVDVESSNKFRRGHYSIRVILLALRPIQGWDKTCGAGACLLSIRFRQTQVGTASIVCTASIGSASRVWI